MTIPTPLVRVITACVALSVAACGGGGSAGDAPAAGGGPDSTAAAPAATSIPTPAPASFAEMTGDAALGERAFVQCRACHAVEPGRNMVGPSLHGIVGREAGSVPGYAYSPANRNSHIVWTEEQLFTYLEAPVRMIPGTKMAYSVRDAKLRADIIAYLATLK